MAAGGAKAEPEEELSSCDSEEWETLEEEGRTKSKNKLLPDGFLDPLPPQKSSKLSRFSGYTQPGQYSSPPPPPPPPPPGFHVGSSPIIEQGAPSGSSSVESRVFIEPEGETFNPSKQTTHKIRDIIRSKFDALYLSWKKIPQDVRDMWFREFEKYFTWLPKHDMLIRRNFERRGSTRFRDMFTDIRKFGERPLWIGENVWAELCALWGSPDYTRRREQNKQNRASDCGGMGSSLHTGGSVPHTEHKRRLKMMLGRDPTTVELYARTHKHQDDQQWVDGRSQRAYDEFLRLRDLQSQSTVKKGFSQQSDYDLWTQAVGGKKKGRIYGLGAQGPAYEAQTSHVGGGYNTIEEMVRMQVAALTADMNARMTTLQAEIEEMGRQQQRRKKMKKKKIQSSEIERFF